MRVRVGDVIEPAAPRRNANVAYREFLDSIKVSRGINDHTTRNPRYIDLSSTIVK